MLPHGGNTSNRNLTPCEENIQLTQEILRKFNKTDPENISNAKICSKSPEEEKENMKKYAESAEFACKKCDKTFQNRSSFLHHLKMQHPLEFIKNRSSPALGQELQSELQQIIQSVSKC